MRVQISEYKAVNVNMRRKAIMLGLKRTTTEMKMKMMMRADLKMMMKVTTVIGMRAIVARRNRGRD
jgi:hypothetical protein